MTSFNCAFLIILFFHFFLNHKIYLFIALNLATKGGVNGKGITLHTRTPRQMERGKPDRGGGVSGHSGPDLLRSQ